jgi:hypothetical protein
LFDKTTSAYGTGNFGEVAAFALHEIQPESFNVDDRGFCTLLFADTPKLRDVLTGYRNGTLTGSLSRFQAEVQAVARWTRDQKQAARAKESGV